MKVVVIKFTINVVKSFILFQAMTCQRTPANRESQFSEIFWPSPYQSRSITTLNFER